ncbi:hypothetical protein Tco_1568033 [Tanacetum coccineum]
MADTRTMAQLLQSTQPRGYEDALSLIPEIVANNFEAEAWVNRILSRTNSSSVHDKEDPHAHIRYCQQDHTSTMRGPLPGPPIPTSSVVEAKTRVTYDQVHPLAHKYRTRPTSVSLPYPSRRDNEKSRNQANEQIDKFYEIFKEMSFEISFTDALVLMPKFASTLRTLLGNKEKLTEANNPPPTTPPSPPASNFQ